VNVIFDCHTHCQSADRSLYQEVTTDCILLSALHGCEDSSVIRSVCVRPVLPASPMFPQRPFTISPLSGQVYIPRGVLQNQSSPYASRLRQLINKHSKMSNTSTSETKWATKDTQDLSYFSDPDAFSEFRPAISRLRKSLSERDPNHMNIRAALINCGLQVSGEKHRMSDGIEFEETLRALTKLISGSDFGSNPRWMSNAIDESTAINANRCPEQEDAIIKR
jgi:hypothetical protein